MKCDAATTSLTCSVRCYMEVLHTYSWTLQAYMWYPLLVIFHIAVLVSRWCFYPYQSVSPWSIIANTPNIRIGTTYPVGMLSPLNSTTSNGSLSPWHLVTGSIWCGFSQVWGRLREREANMTCCRWDQHRTQRAQKAGIIHTTRTCIAIHSC